jgi:hypothetical protein
MDREKLRNFMIKYADRILYGTDIGGQPKPGKYEQVAQMYYRSFQILETDQTVKGGFFGQTETKGLALPVQVLEKIYYTNAARLYPRVKDVLTQLGCKVGLNETERASAVGEEHKQTDLLKKDAATQ